jgi:hypothetical protein
VANPTNTCSICTTDQDAFKARMEAQCYEIEQYRLAVACEEGRRITADEAAFEWIGRYAQTFGFG